MTVLSRTEFRVYLQDLVKDALGVPTRPGPVTGAVNEDLAFVWWEDKAEGADVNEENDTYVIRAYIKQRNARNPQQPLDPAILESLAEQIDAALKPHQTLDAISEPWFFRITELKPLYDEQCVEATLMTWQKNTFTPWD